MNPEFLVHDLANKLAISHGRMKSLSRKLPGNKEVADVIVSLDRALEITTELRQCIKELTSDTSSEKLQSSNPVSTKFFKAIAELYKLTLAVDVASVENISIAIDEDKFKSLSENIFENAAKAGATIIKVTGSTKEGRTVLKFSDNGKGCEKIHHIGTGFTDSPGGSGTGTKIVKEYAKDAGGSATWTPNPFGGLCVMVSLRQTK